MRTRLDKAPIAVVTALSWESAAVRAGLRQVRREEKGVWRGMAGQRSVLVITGGIGLRRTQETLDRFAEVPFAALVSAGCAGALIPGLIAGQLIVAPDIRMRLVAEGAPLERFGIDAQLLAHMRTAAARAAVPIAEGSLLTSATMILTPEDKIQQGRATGAIAVEMESGVLAAFAQAQRLPFLAVRVILDPVDSALPTISDLITPAGQMRPLRAMAYAATHPHHLPLLLALKRLQTVAAQSLVRLGASLFPLLASCLPAAEH